MTPTFLGSSASATGSTATTGSAPRNTANGSDRRDFDALLNAEPARKPTTAKADSKQAKPEGTAKQPGQDTATNATDDASRRPGSTAPGDSTDPVTSSAASETPATPEPTDDTDTAPWPPLGLAGLALAGPEAVTVQAAPAANADSAAKTDPVLAGLPSAAPLTAAPALTAATA